MVYRREIDGLRALAVLPVILFHAGFETFSGGFVGVDVFFVISGYLITTIILAELEQGKFSIVNFYERRARRILPALFLVMLVCIPFAWFWLLPRDMKDFSQSLVAVSLFASNILFWRETGYFDTAAELKPLLHTWSLAIEEQFYVLFPLFLMLFWKLGRRWILLTLALVFLASLAVAQWGTYAKPSAAFYLLPTRGWELLIGVFAAFYLSKTNRKEFGKAASEVGGWFGLALIFYAVFSYNKSTPFPGLYALVPTLGTVLFILFATQQTSVGKFVGNRTFVGVGLISYSAYLWHQPLFAFARQRSLTEPSNTIFLLLLVFTLLLAYLSWRYVEAPFRKSNHFDRKNIFSLAFLGSFIFLSLGIVGHTTDGKFINRSNSFVINQLDFRVRVNRGLSIGCDKGYNTSPNCLTSPQPEVLLWGDSFAMHLAPGLIASNPDIKMVQKTVSVCGPFLGIAPIDAKYVRSWSEKCLSTNESVFDYLKDTKSIKYVVLSSHFGQFLGDKALVLTKEGVILKGRDVALQSMLETVTKIRSLGKVPVVFSPTPQNGQNIGVCLKKATFFGQDISLCDVRVSDSLVRQANIWIFLSELEKYVTVVNFADFLCTDSLCSASLDNVFIYRDVGHLSHEGSAYLGKRFNFYDILVEAK
jgi:peptidoglycan/LPS O-acetylase OafA/YrhL